MAEVIDIRPDSFLRAIRDGKNVLEASATSGLSEEELASYLSDHPKFSKAVVECFLECAEEKLRLQLAETIAALTSSMEARIVKLRECVYGD